MEFRIVDFRLQSFNSCELSGGIFGGENFASQERRSRTLADGLRTQSVGTINFEHIRKFVDDIVTVSEDEIRFAMEKLAADPKTVAEPSGAVAVAGFMFHRDALPKTRLTVAVISGGNIEPGMLQEIRKRRA